MQRNETVSLRTEANAGRLFSSYLCFFFSYLLIVFFLHFFGIEALYRHPTPFYGFFKPVFNTILVPVLIASSLTIFWTIAWYPLLGDLFIRRNLTIWLGTVVFVSAVGLLQYSKNAALRSYFLKDLGQVPAHVWVGFFAAVFFFGVKQAYLTGLSQSGRSARETFFVLIAIYVFTVVFAISLAMLRGGWEGVAAPYARQSYEYINDIGKGMTIRGFFREYNKLHPYLSMHSKVHPPGPVVLLWILADLGAGRTPLGLSLATVFFGSLTVFPLYMWIKDMADRQTALWASLLYSLSPMIVLFTATSADILFMPFTVTTLFLFGRAVRGGSLWYGFGAGVGYAIMSLLSFSLIGVGVFFGFVGLFGVFSSERRKFVFRTAVVMAITLVLFHGLVRLWSGFDVIACFRLCKEQFDTDQSLLDRLGPRYPWWAWKFFNPMCWIFFVGIPITVLTYQFVANAKGQSRVIAIILVGTLLGLNMLYLARGEGERSAMYIFPFFVLPAAMRLNEMVCAQNAVTPLAVTVFFMAFQTWFVESYLYTYW